VTLTALYFNWREHRRDAELVPLAKHGRAMRQGEKKGEKSDIRKWVDARLVKEPDATAEQLWDHFCTSPLPGYLGMNFFPRLADRFIKHPDGKKKTTRTRFRGIVSEALKDRKRLA
jgi:hypothetical protein